MTDDIRVRRDGEGEMILEGYGRTFRGMRIIVDDSLLRRSWRERLFTRPWHPLVSHKKAIKDGEFLVGNGQIVCNSVGYSALRQVARPSGETGEEK